MNESQIFYENNINLFFNGMSMLAVNALDTHGKVHEING